jgi:hypothetical protein
MSTTWQTITVRVRRPPGVQLGEFLAAIWTWLDHHCIVLADLKDSSDGYAAEFDNPRDARLFEWRFAARSTSTVPARI